MATLRVARKPRAVAAALAATEASPMPPLAEPSQGTAPPRTAQDFLDLAEGTRLRQFEIIRELGRGGMGQVFQARDTKLGRMVAIKFLALDSPELVARFLVEAKATARCQHENIVVIHEVDEWSGRPYMVLEYLQGTPLSREVFGTVLPAGRAVDLMIPVVRALVRAHELSIVHRDLKPENIFVTNTGVVKVLDFGIAKLFQDEDPEHSGTHRGAAFTPSDLARTNTGGMVGTWPYMSPEQWGIGEVDYSSDLWAIGIIFWSMLVGKHPVQPFTLAELERVMLDPELALPSIGLATPSLPAELERVVDRCLAKDKLDRFDSAAALLDELLAIARADREGQALDAGAGPYPGLVAFQESDARRFFGRDRDIAPFVRRLEMQPLVAVVGPSGVGKSSFVRAGIIPELKASGQQWECVITRPGSSPVDSLASLLSHLTRRPDQSAPVASHAELVHKVRTEPGYLGAVLRDRARHADARILLFVDQFEELYTLVSSQDERLAYTRSLAAVADDPRSPLRVMVAMRSDLLDRAAEDPNLMSRLTPGLSFLPPISAEGTREALVEPLLMLGFEFEAESIVDRMLEELQQTPNALPLLQFTAAKLWDARDERRKILTLSAYDDLGGVAGALAAHADSVIRGMPAAQQSLAREVFQRLVTADGTRDVVVIDDLEAIADGAVVRSLVESLVDARLLTIRELGDDRDKAVEIVHESLIQRWPTLRRWLDERGEDAAFLELVRRAARQWDSKGRTAGLLWRGDAADEARRFVRRYRGELGDGEKRYLQAVIELATRSARRRRRLVIGAFGVLVAMVAGALIGLRFVQNAEDVAQQQRVEAQRQARLAERQLAALKEAQAAQHQAEKSAEAAQAKVKTGQEQLNLTYEQLKAALATSERDRVLIDEQRRKAEKASKAAEAAVRETQKAKRQLEVLLERERARYRELEKKAKTLIKSSDL